MTTGRINQVTFFHRHPFTRDLGCKPFHSPNIPRNGKFVEEENLASVNQQHKLNELVNSPTYCNQRIAFDSPQ